MTALLPWLLAAVAVAEPAEIRASFVGNMAVQLSDGRLTLRSDFPYESGAFGYMTWTDALVPAATGESLCLVTHSHRDHFLPALAARFCQKLVGPADVRAALAERALPMGETVAYGPLVINPLATPHVELEHYSHLVEWSGLRFHFTGDTEVPSGLLSQRELDVAFVSPWLLRTVQSGCVMARFARGEKPPLALLEEWIDESYRAVAPKRLVGTLERPPAARRAASARSRR